MVRSSEKTDRCSVRVFNMAALYQLAGLVGTMRDSKTAEQVFHQLIWMNERRED